MTAPSTPPSGSAPADHPADSRSGGRLARSLRSGSGRSVFRRFSAARAVPERRRRSDVVAAVVLVVVLLAGTVLLWRASAVAAVVSRPAAAPIVAPAPAVALPAAFTEAWRAASAATAVPVVAGPAVVTAEGSTVVGRDARTGAGTWSYARDLSLCTVGAGFPGVDDGNGRVLAYYEKDSRWCSELTALRPDTGERVTARNPDVRPGTRLLGNGTFVAATGTDYLEVVRSDLVKTLEYGAVTTPEQAGRQPRTGCTYGSTAITTGRIGVIERCPGEPTDRLTVLSPDGAEGADKPEEKFSVALPGPGAVLVALSPERAAVALPDPARLMVLDQAGAQVELLTLDVPGADLSADPPGGIAAVEADADPAVGGGGQVSWWTGSRTVGLDAAALTPRWTLPDALGPAVRYAGSLVVPVPDGLAEVDAVSGDVLRRLPVVRADRTAPVRLATHGEVLLEQRGPEIVALVPS